MSSLYRPVWEFPRDIFPGAELLNHRIATCLILVRNHQIASSKVTPLYVTSHKQGLGAPISPHTHTHLQPFPQILGWPALPIFASLMRISEVVHFLNFALLWSVWVHQNVYQWGELSDATSPKSQWLNKINAYFLFPSQSSVVEVKAGACSRGSIIPEGLEASTGFSASSQQGKEGRPWRMTQKVWVPVLSSAIHWSIHIPPARTQAHGLRQGGCEMQFSCVPKKRRPGNWWRVRQSLPYNAC